MALGTYEDIADSFRAAIEARTPAKMAGERFHRYPGDLPEFSAWAEAAQEGAFRVFDVRHAFDTIFVPPHDLVGYLAQHSIVVELAYPDAALRHGTGVDVHGDLVLDADIFEIDRAIGQTSSRAGWHASLHDSAFQGCSVTPYPGGRLLRLVFQLTYNRSIPS